MVVELGTGAGGITIVGAQGGQLGVLVVVVS